jgi:hypothetical protein
MKQFVVCAAMKMKDGLIVTGIRHYSPEMRLVLERLYGERYDLEVEETGFVDQFGNFLTRKEAWVIADAQGQIRRITGFEEFNPRPPGVGDVETLFSENLY